MSFPNPIFCFVPEPPVAFQEVQAESPSSQGPVLNTLSSPPSSPPSTSTPSVGGGGNQKRKEQEVGLGQQEFKTNNKKQDQERRKKEKNNNQKARSSRGRFNKKRKKKKDPFFGKKEKKKKFFVFFYSKFCGETSRDWALFSKISKFFNLLQMLAFSASNRPLEIAAGFWWFNVSSICQLNFLFKCFASN